MSRRRLEVRPTLEEVLKALKELQPNEVPLGEVTVHYPVLMVKVTNDIDRAYPLLGHAGPPMVVEGQQSTILSLMIGDWRKHWVLNGEVPREIRQLLELLVEWTQQWPTWNRSTGSLGARFLHMVTPNQPQTMGSLGEAIPNHCQLCGKTNPCLVWDDRHWSCAGGCR